MKQITLLEDGILQRRQSKTCEVTKKKTLDYVEYWNEIHQDTNWNEASYDLKYGKKSNKQLFFKMVGTGEPKEYCGDFITEGCANFLNHPHDMVYAQNRRLTCKRAECSVCWDSWLIRESSRVTERIEKFRMLSEKNGFRSSKPIHVIVSPPKWLWNVTWTELKKTFRRMVKRAGVVGGVSMFHAFRLSGDGKTATETEMKEKKARVEDAMHATKAAVEEGIVPGGGVALIRAAEALDALDVDGDQRIGVNIVKRSIEEPLRWIAQNAGLEGAIVVQKVRDAEGNNGFNAQTEVYEDLVKAGVIDPTKVVRTALQNACSISSLLLTTEALITEIPEEKGEGAAAGGPPPGMGGMY